LVDPQSFDLNQIALEDLHRAGHLANLVLALQTGDSDFCAATRKRRHGVGERAERPGDRAANPESSRKNEYPDHAAADNHAEPDRRILAPRRLLDLNGKLPVLFQQLSGAFLRFFEKRYGLRRYLNPKLAITLRLVSSREGFLAAQILGQLGFSGFCASRDFLEQVTGGRFPVLLENLGHPLQCLFHGIDMNFYNMIVIFDGRQGRIML